MYYYFVVRWNAGHLLCIKHEFSTSLAPVMHPQMLNDFFQNLIILLLRRSEIGPSQVLELCYDASTHNITVVVFCREL